MNIFVTLQVVWFIYVRTTEARVEFLSVFVALMLS